MKGRDFKSRVAQCDLTMFVPPKGAVRLAEERTGGMVHLFVMESRGGVNAIEDLRTLVRSAYLQGVTDAAQTIAKQQEGKQDAEVS